MTAPALTDSQLAHLKVLATAAALAYHDTTVPEGERVDVAVSYAVHGDLRLVAADVLEAVCLHARAQGADSDQVALKRFKIDGEYEEEYFQSARSDDVLAEAWCARASRLRAEVSNNANTGPIRSPVAAMQSGSNPAPVFVVNRSLRERS